ncbi:MAG: flagellar motor protein MotB [Firmicutes bacterium]|nr:flagellar motor protein MotB [Bacillota bacterium]
MERKKSEGEHGPSMERWLLTYADLITLLMAFFVIMYAMSTVDASKYQALAQSLKSALGLAPSASAVIPNNLSGAKAKTGKNREATDIEVSKKAVLGLKNAQEERKFSEMMKQINEFSKANGISTSLEVKEDVRGIVINLSDKVLFESGKADLSPQAMAILDNLANILLPSGKAIKVDGHTDNVPIHNERYPSNWHLSTDRAVSVIMYWIAKYPAASSRLSASGYGEYRPVATNNTPEGRAKNRRVEIIVLRDIVSMGEPGASEEATNPVDHGDKLPK